MWTNLRDKNSRGTRLLGSTLLWVLPSGTLPASHSEEGEKSPYCSGRGRVKGTILKYTKAFYSGQGLPSRETNQNLLEFYQSFRWEEKMPNFSQLYPSCPLQRRGNPEKLLWSSVQRQKLTKRLSLNYRTSPAPTPHHNIIKEPLTIIPFTQYIISGNQDKNVITKGQKIQFEEKKQASQLDSDMAEMLELSYQELK